MNKFYRLVSSILIAFALVACDNTANDVDNYETPTINVNETKNETDYNEVNGDIEEVNDIEDNLASESENDEHLDNLISNDLTISSDSHLDTSDLPLIRLSKEQFDAFLYDLVANPDPNEGILFISAEIIEDDVIELQLDLKAGSLEAAWITPIWDLLIRQLYVNSEYQNEPFIRIIDINGEIISERNEPFGQG